MHHPIITGCLLGVAVTLCICCSLGLAIVRDAYQRLQFSTPITSLAMPLFAAAVWVADPSWQSKIKAALIAAILMATNAVLSHATARAVRIRETEHLPPTPDDHIALMSEGGKSTEPPRRTDR